MEGSMRNIRTVDYIVSLQVVQAYANYVLFYFIVGRAEMERFIRNIYQNR